VALTEPPAEWVSFQWHQPSFPPTRNVNSVALAEPTAGQFSGKYAIYATFSTFDNADNHLLLGLNSP
jgi:hypothetical protein